MPATRHRGVRGAQGLIVAVPSVTALANRDYVADLESRGRARCYFHRTSTSASVISRADRKPFSIRMCSTDADKRQPRNVEVAPSLDRYEFFYNCEWLHASLA